MTEQNLITTETKYIAEDDGGVVRQHTQEIPDSFLSDLKRERENSKNQKEGDFMRVASVPVVVHEQWLREGFDMMKASPKEILQRLNSQDLNAFITTKKSV
tara:strand:- start:1440 stop:1742 length:303 start_codon:yes stop_codon:yes gene_type:complete